jgi:hypothetical protein
MRRICGGRMMEDSVLEPTTRAAEVLPFDMVIP